LCDFHEGTGAGTGPDSQVHRKSGVITMPVRLAAAPHEKVWGSPLTEPWFRNPEGRRIGEGWFKVADSAPLLVKLLFTSGNLSIQVHPDDQQARAHGEQRGKTEMWHVLRAEKGSVIGLG